ncbi:MAG: PadR family transcriptional regulator [Streptosporangiales bacterium]|nr:PadR family transcriptional regulator [Streptosporangiales bacterium]
MAVRRSAASPLALAVLALLSERSMHPYEIASEMRVRGIEHSIRLNYGSLYSVVDALRDAGYITAQETVREGKRPERTIYAVTEEGYAELRERLRSLLGRHDREYPRFMAGLAFLEHVPRDEAVELLQQRTRELDQEIGHLRAIVTGLREHGLERIAIVEAEYLLTLWDAEAAWVRELTDDLATGRLAPMDKPTAWPRREAPTNPEAKETAR